MFKHLSRLWISVLAAVLLLTAVSVSSVGAAEDFFSAAQDFIEDITPRDGDRDSETSETQEDTQPTQETTVYVEPTTVPTEPATEWVPAYVETTPPDDYEAIRDEYNELVESAEEATGLNNVKMDKSISNKAYTTDNIAGIVSWICVAVGLVVVLVMLVTTKVAGRSSAQGK